MNESYAMKMNMLTKESPKQRALKGQVDVFLDKILDDIRSEASVGNYYLGLGNYGMSTEVKEEVELLLIKNGFKVEYSFVGWRDIND